MTTSTTAVRQSSAGVGVVLSGPRNSPIALSSPFGLSTNQGAVAIVFPLQALALGGDQVINRALQCVGMREPGECAQALQVRSAATYIFEVLAIRFPQRNAANSRTTARTRYHQLGEMIDADLAIVPDVCNHGVTVSTRGKRIERDHGVAHIAE